MPSLWRVFYLVFLLLTLNKQMFAGTNKMIILTDKCCSQPAITCSKLTTETLEQDVKYV